MTATGYSRIDASRDGGRPGRGMRGGWLVALFIGAFAVACTEFIPVGLLRQIANDLGTSTGTAGQLVTVNALALAIGTPWLVAMFTRADQRRVLLGTLAAFAASHILAALAPNYPLLLISRVASGATMGLYLATAIAVAARLAEPGAQARAIATVVAGVSTATALGVPISTLLGQNTTWRLSLGAIAGLGVIGMLAVATTVQTSGADRTRPFGERLSALGNRAVLTAIAAVVVFWAASFAVFTYLVPLLEARAGMSGPVVTGVLFLAGLGAVGGNLLGGRLADSRPRLALTATAAVTAVALIAVLPASETIPGAIALVAVWQLAAWSFVPAIQVVLYRIAGIGRDLALSLAVSAFNVGIVVGAGLGGFIIDHSGLTAVAQLGAALSIVALALVYAVIRFQRTAMAEPDRNGDGQVSTTRVTGPRATIAPRDSKDSRKAS